MINYEEEIMTLIGAAGDSKDKSFKALAALKDRDVAAAKKFILEASDADAKAHNIQTKLITAEMDKSNKSVPMSLLMAHAQDHFMASKLAKELIEQFIEIFEVEFNK